MPGGATGSLPALEVAARLRHIAKRREVSLAARMVSLADTGSPTWADEAEARKVVDVHVAEWATSEFGSAADKTLIEFIEPVTDDIFALDDCSLWSEWELAFEVLGHMATPRAIDFLERIGGYPFKFGADPESEFWSSARRAIKALGLVGTNRSRALLMCWFEAIDERWDRDENVLWELLPAVAPYLNAKHLGKILWLGGLGWQDVQKRLQEIVSAHSALFKPSVVDGLRRRDPAVTFAVYPLFRQSCDAEEIRLLAEVRDDPAADPKLRHASGHVLNMALRPGPNLTEISPEQISKWRSLAAEAGYGGKTA